MKTHAAKPPASRRSRYMIAMVLGTALSALGGQSLAAAPEAAQAVNDISRYCTACWRNARLHPDCWTDCTQEVFCRLLERVEPRSWNLALAKEGDERREFLRAIDTVKKRSQRSRKFAPGDVEEAADRRDLYNRRRADDLEAVRYAAQKCLSDRQQQIIQMSFEGWSVADIAAEMSLPPERVSDEKYKAITKLRHELA